MAGFVVRSIGRDITTEVRTTLRAPGCGHPVHREVARGTGPCRECLCAFDVGREERLLFTYNPFWADVEQLAQPGPVFIHAAECDLDSTQAYPKGLTSLPVVAQAHHDDGTTSAPRALMAGSEADSLRTWLDEPSVRFLHLRHADAGCYVARVDRVAIDQV